MTGNAKEIVEEFMSSLSELTNNSKPLISMLTILAEDYIEHAPAIVEAVEAHLFKVSTEIKLPVLYLIDSIIKVVNKVYLRLFAKKIVNIFVHVFEKGNENTRMNMWKLRTTWNEVFLSKILYPLDCRVSKIDPAWPITSKPPSNKKNSKSSKVEAAKPLTQSTIPVSKTSIQPTATVSPTVVVPQPIVQLPTLKPPTESEMQKELMKKQKLLLVLQKQKIDLELMQAKASLEQQQIQLDKQSTLLTPSMSALPEDAIEASVAEITSSPISHSLDKHTNTSSLLKPTEKACNITVTAANPMDVRDPRLKLPVVSKESIEKIAKQQVMQQLELLKNQNKVDNNVIDIPNDEIINTSSNVSSIINNNNCIKNSSNTKSSTSSRKIGSKSRSKSSSPPSKSAKLDDSSSPQSEKYDKKSKSRKDHTPSPQSPYTMSSNSNSSSSSYRIPKRRENSSVNKNNKLSAEITPDDEEQSCSSSDSPPYDPAAPITSFKDLKSSTRHRNYIRRNKEGSRSPESSGEDKGAKIPDASKDEDLRTGPLGSVNLVVAAASAAALENDLDLRVLAVPGSKRPNSELSDASNAKKNRSDKFDNLFGREDVDLRTLTNPKAGRPPTPPPPVISSDKTQGNGWAKLKTPIKRETDTPRPLQDRNRDKFGRPRLYSRNGLFEDGNVRQLRGQLGREFDQQNERNIAIIIRQAAEQLSQGDITKNQYNKLIQEVLQMSEDQKLRAAQRKEQELGGMLTWEKGDDPIVGPTSVQQQMHSGNEENMSKDYPMPSCVGPRWQGPWPSTWGPPPSGPVPFTGPPPPPFPPGGPIPPWNNPARMYGPMRPDFSFPPPFNPRIGPPPIVPNGPLMMPAGPLNPMVMNSMTGPPMSQILPNMMMTNGPVRSDMQKRSSPNSSSNVTGTPASGSDGIRNASVAVSRSENDLRNPVTFTGQVTSGELPSADPALLQEISNDTMKSINIDNIPREIRYYGNIGIVFMNWDDPRDIGFQDGSRRIFINGKDSILCNFNEDYKEFTYEGEIHRIKLGTPTRELYVDDKWYECYFGGRPITVDLGNKKVNINLEGPIPQVKIGTIRRTDLVIGKINLIINARNMVPVFLDSKPQMFEVEGHPCTLEFTDALQTVLLNGRPFRVEFGGLPKPVIIGEKKQFIRFSVLPRGIRAGHVKITGMRGEQPNETSMTTNQTNGTTSTITAQSSINGQTTTTTRPSPLTISTISVPSSTSVNPNVPPGLDLDSTSQDCMDTGSATKNGDNQLDVLSSIVPSVMAPSSGLSYQAEPAENPQPTPVFSLPTNVTDLFQRLVETGIVPSLNLSKKQDEEEIRESNIVIHVSFDKPETLKTKQPTVVTALYSGMQCSSCGQRFAPEMATHYSHHLDWHFRQNRKERDSIKKPQSRSWYYDVSDWTQFEEIEDLDERAQSWFETEKQAGEASSAANDDSPAGSQQPSVSAGSSSPHNVMCEVCHEIFEQHFNEEIEEWQIRPAIRFEGKNFHPICLEDHKRALEKSAMELEQTMADMEGTPKENVVMDIEIKEEPMDEKPVIKEEIIDMLEPIEEINLLQPGEIIKSPKIEEEIIDEMDDSELIEIIEPLPRKIEVEDLSDDSSEEIDSKEGIKEAVEKIQREQKLEEKIPDDVPLIFENVRIKEEPIDDLPVSVIIVPEAALVDTTQVAVKSSIDGNVELQSNTRAIPAGSSRIKINITKSLNTKEAEEPNKKTKKEKPAASAPAKPLFPAAIKHSLQGKKLSILPTVEKGHELSALCSIM